MNKIDEITQIIGRKFRSFGGGKESFNNPTAIALKDEPLQFAAGVDIKSVIETVLSEVGFDDLLKACEKALEFFVQYDVQRKVISDISLQLSKFIAQARESKDNEISSLTS